MALGLVLLSVTVVGAALGGVTAAESQSSPVEISNWTDLDDIRNNLDADYVLVNDLNETTAGYETVAGPNANGGNGFDPIGGFNASFDGQGNSVANLTIDRPNENNVGLFGSTSRAAVIEEVILTGATVDGSDFVGGLVGLNDQGTMSNSLASGAVDGSSNVGGLVGFNFEGTVSNSLASGAVNGTEVVGGVVGGNLEGTVSNSSASGAVNGTEVVGGLVGENFGGTVSNASASGAVTGSSNVGGLVGENEGTVSESFATGAVTGSTDVGGLIGLGGTVTGSYWDIQATGQSQSAGGIGLNTSQMQGASAAQNMGALDFTSTWRVVTNPPGYPELRGLPDGPAQEPAQFVVSNLTAPAETTVGASITVSATVTNIGETDGPQTVAFRFDGQTVANRTVSLTPDASTTVAFTPTVPDQTGTFEHGVFTADDNQTAEITIVDPGPPTVALSNLRIAGQENTTTVLAGSYNVSVTVSHDGGAGGVVPVELTVGPTTITESITLNASETTTVTFENATGDLSPGSYDVTVSAGNASVTGEVTLSVPVGDDPDPATDTDDDGLLEDTDGDREFTIFDVQAFFTNFQSDPVQTNSALFNFDGSGDGAVTIFDVQALFTELN